MRFRIDLKIFIFLILFYFTKQIQTYAMLMIFALIHELGHLLAGILLGRKPEKFDIMPYGISVSFKIVPEDYNNKIINGNILEVKKIIIALAGPITNLIVIILAFNINVGIFSNLIIIYSNLLLILFNMIPIYPLDGGRILKSILHILVGKNRAEKYMNNISFVILIIITTCSSIIIYITENISIFLIILFLWWIFIKEDLIYRRRKKIYNLIRKVLK